jgi:hypothetical protein
MDSALHGLIQMDDIDQRKGHEDVHMDIHWRREYGE